MATSPPEPRCDATDLLVSQCAHCRGVLDPHLVEQRRRAKLLEQPGWRAASFHGECAHCGEEIVPGDPIAYRPRLQPKGSTMPGAWVGACCT